MLLFSFLDFWKSSLRLNSRMMFSYEWKGFPVLGIVCKPVTHTQNLLCVFLQAPNKTDLIESPGDGSPFLVHHWTSQKLPSSLKQHQWGQLLGQRRRADLVPVEILSDYCLFIDDLSTCYISKGKRCILWIQGSMMGARKQKQTSVKPLRSDRCLLSRTGDLHSCTCRKQEVFGAVGPRIYSLKSSRTSNEMHWKFLCL